MTFRFESDVNADTVITNELIDFSSGDGLGVCIGLESCMTGQGTFAVAVGYRAGQINQGQGAVAVGAEAGQTGQGTYSIAIGFEAGQLNEPANTIVLNASGVPLNPGTTGVFVSSVRAEAGPIAGTHTLVYDAATSEVLADSSKSFVITHPLDESKYLVHTCLEGPEVGVYYRGTAEIAAGETSARVELPKYCVAFNDFSVFLSPVCEKLQDVRRQIAASEVRDNAFTVFSETAGKFHWCVYGKRGNVAAEPDQAGRKKRGIGPYVWLE